MGRRASRKKRSKKPLRIRFLATAIIVCIALVAAFVAGASLQSKFGDSSGNEQMQKAYLVRVVDGDTIVVKLDGQQQKVRLIGIDAPESVASDESRNSAEGVEASNYLKGLVSTGQTLYLEKDVSDTDKYGRLLRYVWVEKPGNTDNANEIEEKMLEGIIVSAGYAQARTWEPDHAHEKVLQKLMKQAVAAGRGVSYLWND